MPTTKEIVTELVSHVDSFDSGMYKSMFSKKQKGEETIASIAEDEFLKKMFTAITHARREIDQFTLDLKYDPNDIFKKRQIRMESDRHDVMKELFWYLIKIKFELYDIEKDFGLRENWEIVASKPSGNEPPEFVKRLFGME